MYIYYRPVPQVLWLQGRNYNDSMCQEISKCHNLRALALNHLENITPYGLKFIASLTNLEMLQLLHADNISPPCFTEFFMNDNMRNLTHVNLFGTGADDTQVEKTIRKNCPNIREISFRINGFRKETIYIYFGIALTGLECENCKSHFSI